ncbi:hypothetical protein [Clostridium sp.]|uniref:hypothetical protein n=1 Tax=Clostridium sp. TaxID=1506 RepID=UPI00307BF3DC
MKQKISTQLATGFALIVLITVLLIGAVANGLINRQFERYVALQRKNFSEQLQNHCHPSMMRGMVSGM